MINISSVDSRLRLRDAVRLRPELLGVQHPGALGFGQIGKILVRIDIDHSRIMPHVGSASRVPGLMSRTYASPEAFKQALESHIRTAAQQRTISIVRMRQRFIAERLAMAPSRRRLTTRDQAGVWRRDPVLTARHLQIRTQRIHQLHLPRRFTAHSRQLWISDEDHQRLCAGGCDVQAVEAVEELQAARCVFRAG